VTCSACTASWPHLISLMLRRPPFCDGAGTISDQRFEQAIEDLTDLPRARFPMLGLMPRAFELRANATAYDACYVALAEALDWPLYTAERRLAHASGTRCTMQLITLPAEQSDEDPHAEWNAQSPRSASGADVSLLCSDTALHGVPIRWVQPGGLPRRMVESANA